MQVVLAQFHLPAQGAVKLNMQREFVIQVTAEAAQRKVSRWLWNEVSMLISADPPTLVIGEQIVWRVSAYFSAPGAGRVGVVGTVDIDVETGQMLNLAKCKAEIEQCAIKLASRLPPFTPFQVPTKYVPTNVVPAPELMLPKE